MANLHVSNQDLQVVYTLIIKIYTLIISGTASRLKFEGASRFLEYDWPCAPIKIIDFSTRIKKYFTPLGVQFYTWNLHPFLNLKCKILH